MKMDKFEYLLSRHYLKKLVAAKVITYEEFDEIDKLNKQRFLCSKSLIKTVQSTQ